MAQIRAFRGVRYNPALVSSQAAVICQPYDRVRYGLQEQYLNQSPYNVVRIIRGKPEAGDRPQDPAGPNVYTRARATYEHWRTEGILIRDPRPALYAYHQTFTVSGQRKTRKGFIAALELSPFDAGIVLPHEQTHAGPKQDRLRLLRSLRVNTGQVFALYPDPENHVTALLDAAIDGQSPDLDAVDTCEADVRQQMWIIHDPELLQAVQAAMAPKRNLIIADGHHRYETALTYQQERGTSSGDWTNYCMATLVSMDDPGLVILPTHREVFGLSGFSIADLLSSATPAFEVTPVPDLATCIARLASYSTAGAGWQHAFGLYAEGQFHLLRLVETDLIDRAITGDHSDCWKSLDVSIAQKVLLEEIVGLTQDALGQQSHIRYHRDPGLAIRNVDAQEGNLVLLLNPTRIDQVKTCAAHGDRMPQKSTDFYPKMVAGLTMMPLDACLPSRQTPPSPAK